MLRDAIVVWRKDLLIEWRARVAFDQILPFALAVLLLFGFALDVEGDTLPAATPGLFWVTVLFCALLATQRSFALESTDGLRDALRLSGLDPGGVYLGKAAALATQLLVVEAVLVVGVAVLYGTPLRHGLLLAATCGAATAAIAAAGSLYGVLAAGLRVRETLLPLLLLPVLAPVLLGASEAFDAALGGMAADGWPWCGRLVAFAAVYVIVGILAFGPLLEES